MSLFWLVVILLGIVQASWIIEFYKAKYPRRVVLKDWFNSIVWSLGWIACLAVSFTVIISLSTIQAFGNWSGLYSNADWYTIVSIVGINSVGPFFTIALLLFLMAVLLWVCKKTYKDIAIWKYTPEDIVIKDKYKAEKKEKNKKRLPSWLFKIMYPEKKKKGSGYPRLAKFFLLDLEDK